MRISILVQSDPFTTANGELALRFAQSVVLSNHDLYRVFFYKQAVSIASKHAIAPQDEMQLTEMWIDLARKSKVELIVCVAAGQRRGLVQTVLADEFEIAGLGQMVEAMIESDRTVTF